VAILRRWFRTGIDSASNYRRLAAARQHAGM